MGDGATAARRPPGRPRKADAEQRILDAAIDEYLDRGATGFTIDGVARRAGVGKSTVYLRWPDRDALLVDSVLARSRAIEDVDTGSLRGDLIALSANMLRFLLDPVGFATLRLTVEAAASRAAPQVTTDVADRHRRAAGVVLRRAADRGEPINPITQARVIECLYGAITMKVLAHGLEPDITTDAELVAACTELVDLLLPLLLEHGRPAQDSGR
ncbi:TetR/AcrR family transcriptional regulator [Frankia sp. AiPs1]|uniref:TetR/AcrR family transcriptional regulator n=1 Tax=Frankia sp. AiPs1 TaxID=573493 RepID=UPI002043D014|nr:TetR/AcrR family transcriptional regulator [Frankia sp. AiPs1]MCM3923272.1 TetR/AcrR family transcriptional regulator [Frankia sp. AiPs1]